MIAFHILGRPVYRYGLFYGMTFLFGYWFLSWVSKQQFLKAYPQLHKLLRDDLDTLVLVVIGAIMLGGRLGHVFLYDRAYYSAHLSDIPKVWEGGMSFIGGVIGVIIALLGIKRWWNLPNREFLLLGDLILCIVPVGILLGRIGNMLNKELYGKIVESGSTRYATLKQTGLLYDYQVDSVPTLRINTNLIQSAGEGGLTLLIGHLLLWKQRISAIIRPGRISGRFFIVYAGIRFCAEWLKELPQSEMYAGLSISQRSMLGFFVLGGILLKLSQHK